MFLHVFHTPNHKFTKHSIIPILSFYPVYLSVSYIHFHVDTCLMVKSSVIPRMIQKIFQFQSCDVHRSAVNKLLMSPHIIWKYSPCIPLHISLCVTSQSKRLLIAREIQFLSTLYVPLPLIKQLRLKLCSLHHASLHEYRAC